MPTMIHAQLHKRFIQEVSERPVPASRPLECICAENTIEAMKVYVNAYGPLPSLSDAETWDEREARLDKPPVIQVSPEPLWKIRSREEADLELGIISDRTSTLICITAVSQLRNWRAAGLR